MAQKKYFKTKREAQKELERRAKNGTSTSLGVFRMSKGTRHHGEYAVCTEMEWLNTY